MKFGSSARALINLGCVVLLFSAGTTLVSVGLVATHPPPVLVYPRPRQTTSLSAVLPTTVHDLLLLDIFFTSCTSALGPANLRELLIIVPENELPIFRDRYAAKQPANWYFVSERQIVPEYHRLGVGLSGWLRQQDMKLAAYRNVTSDFYLALDSDNVCLKPKLNASEYIQDGKAYACLESIRGGSRFHGKHDVPKTVAALSSVLGIEANSSAHSHVMGWTPQILSKTLLTSMNDIFLSRSHQQQSLVTYLLSNGRPRQACFDKFGREQCLKNVWTEYLAYYILAKRFNLWNEYHNDVIAEGIEVGTCYSAQNKHAIYRPYCLKQRLECVGDLVQILSRTVKGRPMFGTLNDHQLKPKDLISLRDIVKNVSWT